jgi:hypothetical protein
MMMSSNSFPHVNDYTAIIIVQHDFSHCNVNKIIDWLIIVQRLLTDILSPIFSRVRVARSLVSCVVFCSSLYILFLCPLYCLTFFDLWLLISALIPSNFSYTFREQFNKQNIRNYVNRLYCWRYDGAKATVWLLVLCRHGQWVHYFRDDGLMGSGLKTWAMMG